MSDTINQDRRRFLGVAASGIALAQLGFAGPAKAESFKGKGIVGDVQPGEHTSFGSLKQIDAGLRSKPAQARLEGNTMRITPLN